MLEKKVTLGKHAAGCPSLVFQTQGIGLTEYDAVISIRLFWTCV